MESRWFGIIQPEGISKFLILMSFVFLSRMGLSLNLERVFFWNPKGMVSTIFLRPKLQDPIVVLNFVF